MKTSAENNVNNYLFNDVEFETSAAHFSQFPTAELPEIAIVGRSNAGKSSVLNCIFNRKKLAFTAKEPGKTRLLNFFSVRCNGEATARIVDLPGYGYAKVDKSLKKNWERTLLDFILTRKMLVASLMITDCRRPLTDTDEMMLDILLEKKIPYHVLLNKSDKLNNSEKITALEECKKTLEKIDTKFKMNGSCSIFSASKKAGLKELRFKLMEWLIR
ncbi:ribosome biogenesis GTP-binding protein YihA/YsxC [Betaproteobacteria bacterium]|nr:ribosome biogenesis GTP-binding protein YihA/YsxC [Betaproteobacteria bacterium]